MGVDPPPTCTMAGLVFASPSLPTHVGSQRIPKHPIIFFSGCSLTTRNPCQLGPRPFLPGCTFPWLAPAPPTWDPLGRLLPSGFHPGSIEDEVPFIQVETTRSNRRIRFVPLFSPFLRLPNLHREALDRVVFPIERETDVLWIGNASPFRTRTRAWRTRSKGM